MNCKVIVIKNIYLLSKRWKILKYDEKVIGKIIRTEREKRNLTQANLGKRINVTGKQISNYEKGELFPPMSALLSLCEEFDCELGYLLGEEEYADGSKIMTKVTELTGLNKETIDLLHSAGLKVNCWTVDNPEIAEQLCTWGVDFITSNILG